VRTTGIYVLRHAQFGALKVGVGKEARVKALVSDGWEKVVHLGPFPSSQSLTMEGHVLGRLRELHPGSFLSPHQMPHGGWTETFPDTIDFQQVFEYLKDAGVTEEDLTRGYDPEQEVCVARESSGLISLDAQGRARLKDLAGAHTAYEASVSEDGVITLVPVLVLNGTMHVSKKLKKMLADRGVEGDVTPYMPMEVVIALLPENNEVPPQYVTDDVVESVKGIQDGVRGISAKTFLAKMLEEAQ
jgi:hypothetical protein